MSTPTTVTQGWDLIAGITQGSLNTLLASAFTQGVIPSSFSEPIQLPVVGSATVSVTIGAPTVDLNPQQTQGQSGMVGITFPIVSGSITVPGVTPIVIPVGASVEIVTVLAYVQAEFSGGTKETLSVDFTSPLAIFSVIITDPNWQQSNSSVVGAAFKTFLQAQAPGSINLGSVNVPTQGLALAPVGAGDFAIQLASDPNMNTLLLLMVTASGTVPTGPNAVNFSSAPPFIPAGQQSALYISNRLLIQQLIVPQLETSLQIPASSFTVTGSSTTPYTATFTGDQNIPGQYSPELTNLAINVNSSNQVQAAYTVNAHPLFNAGSVYYVQVQGNIFVTIVLNANSQTISFSTTAGTGSGAIEANAIGWLIVIGAIIASFGTVSFFIGTVLAIVVPIILTEFTFPITLPPAQLNSMDQALGSFTWPAQANFPLNSIQMPGDLVFFGTPQVSN